MNHLINEVHQMMEQMLNHTDAEVTGWLEGKGSSRLIQSVTRLPGDASTRRYYRIQGSDRSWILMRMESFIEQGMSLPFIAVQKHLAASGVSVPEILDVEPGKGFMLLEDLGDVTLLRKLQDVSQPDAERHLYEQAIDGLVRLQVEASPARRPGELEGFKLRFDVEKLLWEVHFCIEHFYEGYLKRKLAPSDRQVMEEGFLEICTRLAAEPTVLTHRDLHSRNIMVVPPSPINSHERQVLIDFQDARMGPPQYDLASLLRDSYYQLEESQIDRLVDYYIARYEAASGLRIERERFRELFDLMSVQRNFKAIGSFASFLMKRNDPGYLKYIGNTFENIRRNLLKYPRYARLREVLFHYYYF
jgi:aminoglycoside/choline kinase family phosphotransferase